MPNIQIFVCDNMYESQYKYSQSVKGKATREAYIKKPRVIVAHRNACRKYEEKSGKERYQRGREIVERLKINGCAICGYSECVASLDFHHVNPADKNFYINTAAMNRRTDKIVKELNKCILLCKNCHAKIHYEELD